MPLPEQDVLQTSDTLAAQRNPGFETDNLPSPNGFTAPQAAPIPVPGTGQTMGGTQGSEDYLTKFNQSILGTKDTGITPGKLPNFTVEDVYNPRYRSILPGEDSEEAFAKGQSGWKQFGNALIKMGATAVGTFLGGMAAIPDTISSIAGNSPYNTSLGNNMDQWLNNLENTFPNYYTKWEQSHPFASALPGTEGFANFWGDKFIKNLGFTVGAIGSAVLTDLAVGAATEGLGEIPLIGQQLGKASLWLNKLFTGTNRAEELLSLGRAAGRTGEQLLDLKQLANAAAATKVVNGAKYAISLYGATASEAGMEARDGYNTVKNDLLRAYQREKGYSATGKDLDEIESYARASGNVRFGVNMALLGVSNALQLDGILKSFSAARAGVRSALQTELETGSSIGLAEGSKDTFEVIPKTIWGRVRPLVPSILGEGVFEEGGQYATQIGTENYYERKYLYDKGLSKSLYKKDDTPFDSRDAIGSVVHSVIRGLSDEFTTDEGLENVLLGSLTGAVFGGVTSWMDRSQRNAATQATLTMLNSSGVTGILQNQYDAAATSQRISEDMKQAVKNNDIYKYKNFQHEQFVNFIMSGIKAGRFDVRLEQLNMLRGMDNDEFKKAFGLDKTTDNTKTVNEYVDALVEKANKLKKSYDVINDTFTNPFKFNRKAETREQNEENQKHRMFEEWKGALTYLASINADVDSRLGSISQDLRSIDPHLDQYHVGNFTNRDYLKAYGEQLSQEAKGLQSLLDQKVSGDPQADAKRVKSLTAKAALINIALTDPNFTDKRFEGLFSNLINFHLNGQNDTGTNRIPQEAIPKLIEYGRDVNRLRIQRQSAYDAFDKMSTEEGFNRYFREAQAAEAAYSARAQANANATTNPPGPNTPPTGGGQPTQTTTPQDVEEIPTVQVKNSKGEVKLYEQGKEHFVNLEGKPGANPTKVAVIAQNQDGTVTVALPDGTTQDIPVDNFFMSDTIGDEIQTELDANTDKEDVPPPTPTTAPMGDMQKDLSYGLYSTTDPIYSREDIPFNNFHKRHQNFLFDMGSSDPKDFNQDNKPKLRIIPVTAKTYKALGFPDNFITDDGNDANNSTIRAVYVIDDTVELTKRNRQRDAISRAIENSATALQDTKNAVKADAESAILGLYQALISPTPNRVREQLGAKIADDIFNYATQGLHFADAKGNKLGRVGEAIDPNQAIFSTFATTDLTFESAPGLPGPRYTNKENLDEAQMKEWWRQQRSEILRGTTAADSMQKTYNFQVSRGIPNVINEGSRNNPIDVGLIKEVDLDKPIITVPTLGDVAVMGAFNEEGEGVSSMKSRVKMPLGTPLLNYGGNLIYLNARKFTSAEAKNIFEILRIIADRSRKSEKSGLFKYLHKVIYMANLKEGVQATANSITIEGSSLYLGKENDPIYMTPESLDAEKQRITDFLENTYHSIKNSEILRIARDYKANDLEFSTVKIVDGQITTGETYKNYNHYLLNSDNPPFATNLIVPQENERPLVQKYSVVDSFDFDPAKFKRAEQAAPKPAAAPAATTITDTKSAVRKAAADLKAAGLTEENINNLATQYEEDPALNDEQTSLLLSALDYLRAKLPEMNKQQGVQEAPKVATPPSESPKQEAKKEETPPAEEPVISYVEQRGIKLGFIVTARDAQGNITDIDPQGVVNDKGEITKFGNKERSKELIMGLLTQSQIKQDETNNDDDDEGLGGGNFRQSNDRYRIFAPGTTDYEVGNIDQEIEEVKKIINGDMFLFRKVDSLIKTTGGGLAWGALQDNMIYIYKNAQVGTTYHEAFEAVWYHFVTGKQQQEIYDEFKTRKGTFTTFDGKQKNFSDASLKEAKEQLAEEFKDYKLTGKIPRQEKQKSFFRRLLDFIKWLLGMSTSDRDTLFEKMNKGFYRNFATSLRGPMIQPEYSYYREPGLEKFNETIVQDMLQGMTAEMFGKLFGENSTIIDQLEEDFETTAGAIYDKLHSDMKFFFEDKAAETGTLTAEYGVPYQRLKAEGKIEEANIVRDQVRSIRNTWKEIDQNWDSFVREHMRYLRVFNIEFIVSDEGDIELAEDMTEEDENKNMQEYGADPMQYDAKNNASNRVKLLIASIADSEWIKESTAAAIDSVRSKRESSSLALPKLVQYAKLFNYLLHNTAGINGIYDIWNKLTDMTEAVDTRKLADANVRKLMSRVKFNNGFSGKTNADWRMIMSLEGTLTKQKPAFFRQFTDYQKNTYFKTTVLNSKINQVKSSWISRMKGSGAVRPTTDNKFVFSKDVLNIRDQVAFLNKIGIDITKADVNRLKGRRAQTFNNEVNHIRDLVEKAANKGTAIPVVSSKQLDFDSRLNGLAELYVTYMVGDDTQSQHPNLDGEQTANFVLNNVVSTLTNDANTSETRQEFENKENNQYFKTDIFHQDSILLNKVFFDKAGKKGKTIEVGVVEGRETWDKNNKSASKLTEAERQLYEINNNINGVFYTLLPADAKTEWALNMGLYWSSTNFFGTPQQRFSELEKFSQQMYDWLATEIALAKDYENRKFIDNLRRIPKGEKREVGKSLRFFKDILPKDLVDDIHDRVIDRGVIDLMQIITPEGMRELMTQYLMDKANRAIANLTDWRVLNITDSGYKLYGFDKAKLDEFFGPKQFHSEEELRRLMVFREMNYVTNGIEMHKFFFGDPAQYKDELKRIKTFLSGREYTHVDMLNTSEGFNQQANIELNKTDRTQEGVPLAPGDPGYQQFKNHFNTISVRDVFTESNEIDILSEALKNKVKPYTDINENDGGAYMTATAYREMLWKASGRWSGAQEKQFQWEMAWERNDKAKDGLYTYSSDALRKHDEEILKEPENTEVAFPILKLMHSGLVTTNGVGVSSIDKASWAPLFYRWYKGTSLGQIHNDAQKRGVDYIKMESAHKVGLQEQSTMDMYNEKGEVNSAAFDNIVMERVPAKLIGIQVEQSKKDKGQTEGSQLRKIAIGDLRKNGVPIDFMKEEKDEKVAFKEWNKLDDDQKKKASPIFGKIQRHNDALVNLTLARTEAAMKRLGMVAEGEEVSVPDKKNISDFILAELERRELPRNIAASIQVSPETRDFSNPLEANPQYGKIRSIIYSVLEKTITRPKVNGGQKTMLSIMGMEKGARVVKKKVNGKDVYTSDSLKFYTRTADGTQACEVMLPYWFGKKLMEAGSGRTKEEVMKYLNNTKEGQELLRGIGFRIPTQGLNSVDFFTVKDFLPEQMGDVVVMPSEITAKAGSDFDIDKLNVYLKNYYIDTETGLPKMIRYKGSEEATKEYIIELIREGKIGTNSMRRDLERYIGEETEALEESDIFEAPVGEDRELESMLSDTTRGALNMYYQKALENEYFDSIEGLLSLSENYARLTLPNDAKQLKDYRDKILDLKGAGKVPLGEYGKLLDSTFMMQERQAYMSSKQVVGISAVSQTAHAIAQNVEGGVVVNDRSIIARFPHNTIDGKISMSGLTTAGNDNQLISNINSQTTDGGVDVAKDKFLAEMGINQDTLSTFLTLVRMGADPYWAILFLNQPAIQQFLKAKAISTSVSQINPTVKRVADRKLITGTKGFIGGTRPATMSTEYTLKEMEDMISAYAKNPDSLTQEQRDTQVGMLDDFIRYDRKTGTYKGYSGLAWDMFHFYRGYNWDTARINDPNLVRLKKLSYEKANDLMITPARKVMESTFIGPMMDATLKLDKGLRSIINVQHGAAGSIMDDIARDVSKTPGAEATKQQTLLLAEMSLVDYAIQTNARVEGGRALNTLIPTLLLSKTATAEYIDALKKHIDKKLSANPLIKGLVPNVDKRTGFPSTIEMPERDFDTYTSNVLTDSMRELRDDDGVVIKISDDEADNRTVSQIYKRLVLTAIIQSGSRSGRGQFAHLIPSETYTEIVSDALRNMQLGGFYENLALYRANWNNNLLVPFAEREYLNEEDQYQFDAMGNPLQPDYIYMSYRPISNTIARVSGLANEDAPAILTPVEWKYKSKKVIKIEELDRDPNTRQITARRMRIFRRVDVLGVNGVEPLKYGDRLMFVEINAWGDTNIREYYNDRAQSVLPTNNRVSEVSDDAILYAVHLANVKTNAADYAVAEVFGKFEGGPDIDNDYDQDDNEEQHEDPEEVNPDAKLADAQVQIDLRKAADQYLAEELKKDPRYYWPVPRDLWLNELTREQENKYYDVKGTRITLDNLQDALAQDSALGDQIGNNADSNKSHISGINDPYDDFVIIALGPSVDTEYAPFNRILDAYKKETDPITKEAVEKFLKQYGLGNYINQNPSQLSLFQMDDFEGFKNKLERKNCN